MKANTKRLLIELTATGVASPLLLFLLLLVHAFQAFAVLAYPTVPVANALSGWIQAIDPPQGGGWLPNLGSAILAEIILLPLWTWILLMIGVKLVERFIPKREKA